MIIQEIDEYMCDGCGACEKVCTADVIRMKDDKAVIAYQDDCIGCICCEVECPRAAIEVA
ncbi:ATP-binding protein [Chloroflexota bacterium]